MRKVENIVYKFDELSAEAQKRAIDDIRNDNDIWWFVDEALHSFNAISDCMGLKVKDYNFSLCNYSYVKLTRPDTHFVECRDITGARAYTFIINNFIKNIQYAKYYNKIYYKNNKTRRSKIAYDDSCIFTGMCYDDVFINTWNEWQEKLRGSRYISVEDFLTMLEHNMVNEVIDNASYYYSDEGIIEYIMERDIEFYEDGSIYSIY